MNSRHRKTLEAIFAEPARANIEFAAIEKLLVALGGLVIEGWGSRVRFAFGDRIVSFHRPHPQREAKLYQVEAVRAFLAEMKVKP